MEEQDVLDEVSGDHSGSYHRTTDDSIHFPAYLAYLLLGFKVICTGIIVVMAGWIIVTIKTTRSLHNNNNIYVANLMVADVICVSIGTLISGNFTISYFTGVRDFISCNVYIFLKFSSFTIQFTYLMISIDKLISITFPLRYGQIMKPKVVFGIIAAEWVLAVVLQTHFLFNTNGFIKVAEFGTCISTDNNLLVSLTFTLPVFLASLKTVILNIYFTIKAYQVHKEIQEESKLSGGHSGDNNQLKALKKKHINIKKHHKLMITLLIVVLGTTSIGFLFPLLYIPAVFMESPIIYKKMIRYVIVPDIGYVALLLDPLVYGVYFTQVRKPMIRLLKRITCPCKWRPTAIAPQPQRNRMAWMS